MKKQDERGTKAVMLLGRNSQHGFFLASLSPFLLCQNNGVGDMIKLVQISGAAMLID